jgi:hypothetical protein
VLEDFSFRHNRSELLRRPGVESRAQSLSRLFSDPAVDPRKHRVRTRTKNWNKRRLPSLERMFQDRIEGGPR